MERHKKGKCPSVAVKCLCLLPDWGPFYSCCGYRCLRCKGSLNNRKVPSKKAQA